MSDPAARSLAEEIAAAHNAARLHSTASLAVRFSSGGLAFAATGQPIALRLVNARLSPTEQRISVTGAHPRPWHIAIESSDDLRGRLAAFGNGRRRRWEPEEVGVFAAAALWTYLTMPLLVTTAPSLQRLPDRGIVRRLRVRLPSQVAGHAPDQTLHVGEDRLIVRHDYTATAFGSWARAAQRVRGYRTLGGMPIATQRVVTPRLGPRWPAPVLVWIEVHGLDLDDEPAPSQSRPPDDA